MVEKDLLSVFVSGIRADRSDMVVRRWRMETGLEASRAL